MKWFKMLWPGNWRKKRPSLEECETLEDVALVLQEMYGTESKPTHRVKAGFWQYFGLLFGWIPLMCGLNPFWQYASSNNEPHIFGSESGIGGVRRVIASVIVSLNVVGLFIAGCILTGGPLHDSMSSYALGHLALHLASLGIGLPIALTYGFRMHPKLREFDTTNDGSQKQAVLSGMLSHISSVRAKVLAELETELKKNNELINACEVRRNMLQERQTQGGLIPQETLDNIVQALQRVKMKGAVLTSRVSAINEWFNKAEAKIASLLPMFVDRALVLETHALLETIGNVHTDIARIDARIMEIVRGEFLLIERAMAKLTTIACTMPAVIDDTRLLAYASHAEIVDHAFHEAVSEVTTALLTNADPEQVLH